MYNLVKWLNCSVVKETVMCQEDVIFFLHGLMKIEKLFVQINATLIMDFLLLSFFLKKKKRPLKCIKMV